MDTEHKKLSQKISLGHMGWIPDTEYKKQNVKIATIDAQIAELMAKKKEF